MLFRSQSDLVHVELVTPPTPTLDSDEPATVTAHSSQSSSKSTQTLVQSASSASNPDKKGKGKTSASSSFANLLDTALAPAIGLGLDFGLEAKQRPAMMEADQTHVGEEPTKGAKAVEHPEMQVDAVAAKISAMRTTVKRSGGKTLSPHLGFKKVLTSLARW